jgi:AcrR family transcriptional regulator
MQVKKRLPPGRKVDPTLAERRREEILDAAARLFAERGYSETDTQHLIDEVGVGKGTLYRYFPSKRELFLAAADRVMRQLRSHVDVATAEVPDPVKRVAVAVRAFLEYCSEHPEFVELLVQERAQFRDRTKPTYFVHREAQVRRWRDLYRLLIGAGRVRDIPVEQITDVVSMLLYGCLFTNYFHAIERRPADQADGILDILFHGILSHQERSQKCPDKRRNGKCTPNRRSGQ